MKRSSIALAFLCGIVTLPVWATSPNMKKLAPLLPPGDGRQEAASLAAMSNLDMVQIDWLVQDRRRATDPGLEQYLAERQQRRLKRLGVVMANAPAIVFLRNTEFGNAPRLNMSLSDGPYDGKPFKAGAAIMLLTLDDKGMPVIETLLSDPNGMIRDLDVSYDGKRILFAWKKSRTEDDYHIYEMTVIDKRIRQVTEEAGVADIQPRYLPDDRILYHSTRCVTVVDCNEAIDVVNLYSCNAQGEAIFRLTHDQVSTQFPTILNDGRIAYTRWDYNDRGQIYPQGVFTTNADGTQQTALYGNNSWYPTSLVQLRSIPDSDSFVAITTGHHTPPCGKLALIDVSQGRDEGRGVSLLAPARNATYKKVDKAEQDGALFQYPYPLSSDEYLVSHSLFGKVKSQHFAIYWTNRKGERELLAWDMDAPIRHPLPLIKRKRPATRPNIMKHADARASFYVDDIYIGEGLKGIVRGTVKKLRVIALTFRPAAVGTNYNQGEGGHARVCTPISISGAWDTKTVLGDAEVHSDGSAFFYAPARTPIYFQAIDAKGRAVQSMRSWSTLMPGESFSCVGCHEDKNSSPGNFGKLSLAMKAGPQEIAHFHGPPRGFSFIKEVQPILDAKCVSCHKGKRYSSQFKTHSESESFSLLGRPVHEAKAARNWTESYVALLQATKGGNGNKTTLGATSNGFIHWISPQSRPTVLEPYSFGAAKSQMLAMLEKGHNDIELSTEEWEKLACWIDLAVPFCGDYTEAGAWSQKERDWYAHQVSKQQRLASRERQNPID